MNIKSKKNYFIPISFWACFLLISLKVVGQEIVAEKGSFGIDKAKKMIVWHVSNIDSLRLESKSISQLKFNDSFRIVNSSNSFTYAAPVPLIYEGVKYKLFITKLPLVHINLDASTINENRKIFGHFSYFNVRRYVESAMGIRHRGNLSLTYPKKSFDIEFWTDSISKKSKDLKFKGMRSDDDWILDGLYNEPLRLRSTLATRLWTKMYKPYYLEKEPKAKSGFDVKFVELFKNQNYYGIYALSESVDRKQLQLKEHEDKIILGELFKAESYEGAPAFQKVPEYDNLFPHWGGFQMRYPMIDYRAHWNDLAILSNLVVKGSDEEFMEKIESQIHIGNTIDYYLLVNLFRSTDNLGKNYFLGRYDKAEPYFFVPWDLDGVFGIIQEGKRIPTTNDILSNGLFDRLLKLNPNGYQDKVKLRWKVLRESNFSNQELTKSIAKIYDQFTAEKLYDREQLAWPSNLNNENHYEYLKKWLNDRLLFLDAHFKNL